MCTTNIRDISVKFICDTKANQNFYIVRCIAFDLKKIFFQSLITEIYLSLASDKSLIVHQKFMLFFNSKL